MNIQVSTRYLNILSQRSTFLGGTTHGKGLVRFYQMPLYYYLYHINQLIYKHSLFHYKKYTNHFRPNNNTIQTFKIHPKSNWRKYHSNKIRYPLHNILKDIQLVKDNPIFHQVLYNKQILLLLPTF